MLSLKNSMIRDWFGKCNWLMVLMYDQVTLKWLPDFSASKCLDSIELVRFLLISFSYTFFYLFLLFLLWYILYLIQVIALHMFKVLSINICFDIFQCVCWVWYLKFLKSKVLLPRWVYRLLDESKFGTISLHWLGKQS